MIRILKHVEINKQRWDDCVINSASSGIYALSWYLDIVSPEWMGLADENYNTIMPIPVKKKYGISVLIQPHFCQQLGVYSKKILNKEKIKEYLRDIPEDIKYIDYCINSENTSQLENDFPTGFAVTENNNIELELSDSYEKIYGAFSDNTKRNIRKAGDQNVKITLNESITDDIIAFFKNNKGREFSHLNREYYRLLKCIIAGANKNASVKTYGAYFRDRLCAGAVFICDRHKSYFLFSGSNPAARDSRAMFYLFDRFIFEHAGTGIRLDFEGSNDLNLARFYKSFGAKEYVYLQLRKNDLPRIVKWLKN